MVNKNKKGNINTHTLVLASLDVGNDYTHFPLQIHSPLFFALNNKPSANTFTYQQQQEEKENSSLLVSILIFSALFAPLILLLEKEAPKWQFLAFFAPAAPALAATHWQTNSSLSLERQNLRRWCTCCRPCCFCCCSLICSSSLAETADDDDVDCWCWCCCPCCHRSQLLQWAICCCCCCCYLLFLLLILLVLLASSFFSAS